MKSTPKEIAEIVPIFQKQLGAAWGYYCGLGNLPKTHAYVSMSKAFAIDTEWPQKEFCEKLYAELEAALPIIDKLKPEIERIGGKFA